MLSMKNTRYESKIQATESTTVLALYVTTMTDDRYCKHFNECQKQGIIR